MARPNTKDVRGPFTLCIRKTNGDNFSGIIWFMSGYTFVAEAVVLVNALCKPGMAHPLVQYEHVV